MSKKLWLKHEERDGKLIESLPLTDEENKVKQNIMKALPEYASDIDDIIATRFIRGYSQEKPDPIKTTIEKLRDCMKWRKEQNPRQFLKKELPRAEEFHKKFWPSMIHGVDKLGHPILYENLGVCKADEMVKSFQLSEMVDIHVQELEQLEILKKLLIKKYGHPIYKIIVILNLSGFGIRKLSKSLINTMKEMFKIEQHYYPETLFRFYIVNTPLSFRTVYSLIKPMIHPLTAARINVLGKPKDYLPKMKELMSEDMIPTEIGGSCKCNSDECIAKIQLKEIRQNC